MLRDGGAFALEYSTVSSSLMRKVDGLRPLPVDALRGKRRARSERNSTPPLSTTDLVFQNALDAERRCGPQPDAPIHYEPANRFCRDAANRRRLSTGVMFLDAPSELIIINRGEPTRRLLRGALRRGLGLHPVRRNDLLRAGEPARRPVEALLRTVVAGR